MPAPLYRYVVGDLRTGKITRTLDLTSPRWSTDIEDAGTLEGAFPLRSGEWKSARSDSAPAKAYLACAYVDERSVEHWLAGGPIWTARYTDSTGVLSIGAAALSSYFDHRRVMPVLAADANPAEATVTYTAADLALIAKRLVELAQSHTAGQLPIVLPSDAALGGAGNKHTRTYPGYELATVGERLTQLSEVISGPEVQFVPRRRTDDPRFLEWVMRVGTDATGGLLHQSGADWVFDRTVPRSAVAEIDISTDGSSMTFRSWAAGQGEGEGRPIVVEEDARLPTLGWPLLESMVSSTDTVSDPATLRGHARADLALSATPVETWTVKVARDATPHVGRYRPGDWCVVRTRDHVYVPDGDHRMRITGISSDGAQFVSLSMAPKLGDVA